MTNKDLVNFCKEAANLYKKTMIEIEKIKRENALVVEGLLACLEVLSKNFDDSDFYLNKTKNKLKNSIFEQLKGDDTFLK